MIANKVILNKNFMLLNEMKPAYKLKHFSAFIFISFFYKKKKILTFPLFFFITPWGFDQINKDVRENHDLFGEEEDLDITFYSINKKHNFYLGIFSEGEHVNSESKFWLWLANGFTFKGYTKEEMENITKFERFMKENVFSNLINSFEESKLKILSFIETEIGSLEKINRYDLENTDFSYVTEKVGLSNVNFCENIPSKLEFNLENYFSEEELLALLEEMEKNKHISMENPFPGEIETSIEEYKEFLLTLVGPEKLEYTNLDINKLDLSIEELFCLFLKLHRSASSIVVEKEEDAGRPFFFPDSKENSTKNFFFANYFWYKLKEVIQKS